MTRPMEDDSRSCRLKLNRDYSAATVLEVLVAFCGGHLLFPAPLKPTYIFQGDRAALSKELPGFDWIFPADIQVVRTGRAEYKVAASPHYYARVPSNDAQVDVLSQLCGKFEDNGFKI